MHFQLTVTIGLLFGVGMLFLEGLDGGANIVAIFLKRQAQRIILAGLAGAAGFFKLRFAQPFH